MEVVTACAFISEQPSVSSSEDSAQHGPDEIVAVIKPSAFITNQTAMSSSDSVQHSPRFKTSA